MVRAGCELRAEDPKSASAAAELGLGNRPASAPERSDAREFLERARQIAAAGLDALCLRLWKPAGDGHTLVLTAAIGPVVPFDGLGERVPVEGSELGDVFRGGRPYIVADLQADAPQDVRCWSAAHGIASFAAVPVTLDQQTIGVLAAFCGAPMREHEVGALQRLAALTATELRAPSSGSSSTESEELLAALVQCLPSAVITLDRQGLITRWNASAEKLFGWSEAEVCGKPLPFVLEERKQEFLEHLGDPLPSGRVSRSRTVCRRANGSHCHVQRSARVIYDRRGEAAGRVEVFVDESQRVQTSRCLQVQAQVTRIVTSCRTLEEAAPLLLAALGEWLACEAAELWSLDDDQQTLSRTAVWAPTSTIRDRLAASDLRLQAASSVWPATALSARRPVYAADVDAPTIRALAPLRGALRLPINGLAIPIRTAHAPLAIITCLGDSLEPPQELAQQTLASVADAVAELIVRVRTETALARTQASLRQSQKVEALGLLAGGVAHDFNNLLTIILAYSEMGLGEVDESHPLHELFAEVHGAGARAAAMTRQLLAISRQQPARMSAVSLDRLVDEMERMLARLVGSSITMTVHNGGSLWSVQADGNQLEQVLLNLVVNARDAMPAGGEIVISTQNASLARKDVLPGETRSGEYVELCVRDTGCGMDAATRARVFEPFFTTKDAGRGTGMGMSTVAGIVRHAGGFVRVESEVDVGTAVKVYLPRSTTALAVRTIDDRPDIPPLGTERILVVENDASVRSLICRLLQVRGYTVEQAAHGAEALEILSREHPAVDLVLAELQMPVVDGVTLVRQMRRLPTVASVLLMSGTTEPPAELLAGAVVPFLAKPFTSDALARQIRLVLDSELRGGPRSP